MINPLNPLAVVVPTDDVVVRKLLRDVDQPMCYFGEGPAERRDRLSKALTKLSPEERQKLQASDFKAIEDKKQDEIFYYEGCDQLKDARLKIADYSIRQCSVRLDMARLKQAEPFSTALLPQQDLIERVRRIEDYGSYVDEETSTLGSKIITSCNFNPSARLIATSAKSGRCKLWSVPDMETFMNFKGHSSEALFITFSPKSGQGLGPESANLASCAMDGSISLWNLVDKSPVCDLSGPQSFRVRRVRYHQLGSYLASCCADKSWRLWDIEAQTEILHQEGHSGEVFDIGFHPDGSLACSAGGDSHGRIWDLRTGRSLWLMKGSEGHTSGIVSVDISPNGYHIATGSMDNTVKIWNLRQRKLEYTIPAHAHLVSSVMFERKNGYFLCSSSFDKSAKFWSSHTWSPVKTLDVYDDKVFNIDLSNEGDSMVTCHSRYLRLWTI